MLNHPFSKTLPINRRGFIFIFTLLILLGACKSKKQVSNRIFDIKPTIPQIDQSIPDLVSYMAATSIYGEWFNIDPNISENLILNLDSTFQYITGSNLSDSVKGRWTNKGSEYILRGVNENNKDEVHSKKTGQVFEKKLKLHNGFIYEVNKSGSLAQYYFVQSKHY